MSVVHFSLSPSSRAVWLLGVPESASPGGLDMRDLKEVQDTDFHEA